MGNFMYKIRCAIARFMYGRNGTDHLGMATLALYVLIMLLQSIVMLFFPNEIVATVFSIVIYVLCFIMLFRIFSKNLRKKFSSAFSYMAASPRNRKLW